MKKKFVVFVGFLWGLSLVWGCHAGSIYMGEDAGDSMDADGQAGDGYQDAGGGETQYDGAVDAGGDGTPDDTGIDDGGDETQDDGGVDAGGDKTQDDAGIDAGGDESQDDGGVDAADTDGSENTFYSAVTGEMVQCYMNQTPFGYPAAFENAFVELDGGTTSDIMAAIGSLSGSGGTLTLTGDFNGGSAVYIDGKSNVRIVGEGASINVNGGGGFSDEYSGFVLRNSDSISIEGVTVHASSGHGILVFGGCRNIRILRNHLTASLRSSIIFYSDGTYTTDFQISGNICENFGNEATVGGNSHHGIVTRYVKNGLIIGNYVDGSKNIGMSRMGMDLSTNSWFIESCHNKVIATNYGAKIGYAQTQYIYFHDNEINSMNDGHHSDKAFYIHRTLGGPIFLENNVFWDDYLATGTYDLIGAGCDGGTVYLVHNLDKNGDLADANKCAQDVDGLPPADVMNAFKTIGD